MNMLLQVDIKEKSFGTKAIFSGIKFNIDQGEKVGIIGRNGIGKSTLFNIIEGRDTDFSGTVILQKGISMVGTSQEYHQADNLSTIEYILSGLPRYTELSQIINSFTELQNPSNNQLQQYSDALVEFSDRGYYSIEGQIKEELKRFQLEAYADTKFLKLSGGQKRLSEVIKIMYSNAQIALIDEPTNYMDYVAKGQFLDWMQSSNEALVVITHDRDVLKMVDRIIEIKDGKAIEYRGNYDHYIRQNFQNTSASMKDYELIEKRIKNLKQKVIDYQRLKEKSRNMSTIQRFKRLENNARQELSELADTSRPSFWIDEQSLSEVGYKDADRYKKYQAKNIKISTKKKSDRSNKILAYANNLSVGYESPLFSGINFAIRSGDKLEIHGRNGAGKTTLIKALRGDSSVKIMSGEAGLDSNVRLGIYEQEISSHYFNRSLFDTITDIYLSRQLDISDTKVRSIMNSYLFNEGDRNILVENLSGGQKARLQIIAMLANDPNLIILDEPTSHLDLPSIEELERALSNYGGAMIYISHDNYFRHKLGGDILEIKAPSL